LTDAAPPPEPVEQVAEAAVKVARRIGGPGWLIIVSVTLVAIVALFLGVVRYGVITPQGRAFLEARTSGLKLGRIGTLKIEGLSGDIWRDFGVRRLTISDEKGVWLEGADLHVVWRPRELWWRRFHADNIEARQVTLVRRPTLGPKGKSSAAPVSVDLDAFKLRLVSRPAFSNVAGDFDVSGAFEMARLGGQAGRLSAASRLHPGDHLDLVFDLGRDQALLLTATGREAKGGALAGSLGLPADRPFQLDAKANGTTQAGAFTIRAQTGDTVPLRAGGAWTAQGGSASGHVDLSASSHTDLYERMFGAAVDVDLVGRKAGSSTDLSLKLRAPNLSLDAQGLADISQRRTAPEGVTFSASVRDLSKITPIPKMGAAKAQGVFKLGADGFSVEGPADVANLELLGYRLARARGPAFVGWKKGELTIRASATTEGGAGEGLLAPLGRSPKAEFEGARLKDGRFLIKHAKIVAPNIVVDGKGERGLLGGLSFDGSAKVASLAPIRPGMKGAADIKWSASQARNKPWNFTADAKGAGFATGLSELDRLLGAAPKLSARAAWDNGTLSVADAKLDGASARAKASGVMTPGNNLVFKLEWSAEGPFGAGPVEVSGKASGDGAITGTLTAPRADLKAAFDSIDLPRLPLKDAKLALTFAKLPDGGDGTASLQATSQYGPARGKTGFRFAPGGLELSDLDIDAGGLKAQGGASLRDGRPATADLTVAVGHGAFLAQGLVKGAVKLVDAPGGPNATLDLVAQDVAGGAWKLRTATIKANGPMSRLPLTLDARGEAPAGRWNLAGTGVLAQQTDDYLLTLDAKGRMARTDISTRESAQIRFGGARTTSSLRLNLGDGRADLDLDVGGELANLRADLVGVSLTALNPDLAGRIDARVSMRGQGEALDGELDANLSGARERGAKENQSLDATIHGDLRDRVMTIKASGSNPQGLKAEADLTLPTEASAKPFRLAIDRRRAVQGRFLAQGEIKPLWDLLIGPERGLSGKIDAEGSLAGTLADPRLIGRAALTGGKFEDGQSGLRLQDVAITLALADNAIDVSQAQGADGRGGTVSGAGRISLARDGVGSFRLDMKNFQVIDNELAKASATGQTTINRDSAGKVKLTGALTIDRADVSAQSKTPAGVVSMDVIERNRPQDLVQGVEVRQRRADSGMALDVTLKAPRRIFVKGRGLDVELSLDAHVGGTTASPSLDGVARVVRGEYDFAGKRFEFDDDGVVRLATQLERIRLDLTATREDDALTAVIKISGTAAKPEITLTSTPELPQDEVLSQVLFGSSAAQLSPIEAAQLASALASLAGGGGFDVIGNLRSFARLDRLAFAEGTTGMTVSGGKYVTDDVYVEIIGGGREGPAAQVEWRIRRALSLVSRLGGDGDAKLSVKWRKNYR